MPTFVVLTRLTPEAVKVPGELKRLERAVADHIRSERSYGLFARRGPPAEGQGSQGQEDRGQGCMTFDP